MALVRYRATSKRNEDTGTLPMVSHPTKSAGFVGYERIQGAAAGDFVVPGGHAYKRLPDGEVIADSPYLRTAMRDGALELLPLEMKAEKATKKETANG